MRVWIDKSVSINLTRPDKMLFGKNKELIGLYPGPVNHSSVNNSRPVFITGAPRCGSSWVGEILGNCTTTRYVYEPFNHRWVPALRGHLPHFTYLNEQSPIPSVVQQTAENAFLGLQSWKQLARAAYRRYWVVATRSAKRVVIKDPTASLMSAWVARQFDAQVLFVMRHPCGFASSLDALSWKLGVDRLLRQDALMQDHLEPFRVVLSQARNDKWLTRGAIWASIHLVYAEQMKDHPDWLLYKYEDICNDPAKLYKSIAQKLGMELSDQTLEKIHSLSATNSADPGSTRRNSKIMPDIWRQRMSPGEVDAVMGVVDEFGIEHYTK
jgi:hypothetical protein